MYFGGPLGVLYVGSAILFTGWIGFESYFVCLVTGQLVGSLVFESIGVFHTPVYSASGRALAERIIGIVLVIAAACLIRLPVEHWLGIMKQAIVELLSGKTQIFIDHDKGSDQ